MKLTFPHGCLGFKFVYINYFTCHICLEVFMISTKGIGFLKNPFLQTRGQLAWLVKGPDGDSFWLANPGVSVAISCSANVAVASTSVCEHG